MRLPWGRRQRDEGKSDFRDDRVGESPHLGPIRDLEDAENVTLSGPGRPFSSLNQGAGNALSTLSPL